MNIARKQWLIRSALLMYGVSFYFPLLAQGQADRHRVLIHPFHQPKQGFNLKPSEIHQSLQLSPGNSSDAIRKLMQSYLVDERVQAVELSSKTRGFWLSSAVSSSTFRFQVDGFRLCQFEVKTHLNSQGHTLVLGDVPAVRFEDSYQIGQWPVIQATLDGVKAHAIQNHSFLLSELSLVEKTPCLWLHEGRAHRAWQLEVTKDNKLFYQAVATESMVFDWQPRYFQTTGKATIYNRNPTEDQLTEFDLREMIEVEEGGCYLENPYFRTQLDPTKYLYAYATDCNFIFSEGSSQFQETSLFTNANRALEWLQNLGYRNFGSKPINIVVHATFSSSGESNNALYQPTSKSATIYVGDGDGLVLQNLSVDADVVSHELGHHVVFNTVTNISGESLVIHEGLADYLTIARTGDPCLGGSICPANSNVCSIPQQCLRTADNDFQLGSTRLPIEPHLRSQFISGLLWDLHSKDGIPLDILTKIVLKAIDLFVSNSGYQHLILGLMIVDDLEYEGQYCQTIYDRALQRGLAGHIQDLGCEKLTGLVINQGSSGSPSGTNTIESGGSSTKDQSSKNKSWCGNVGFPAHGSWSLLIMLLLPTLLIFWRD